MTGPVERPGPSEHEAYYSTYIDQVPEGDVLQLLGTQIETTLELLASVSPELETHRYAPDKWTVRLTGPSPLREPTRARFRGWTRTSTPLPRTPRFDPSPSSHPSSRQSGTRLWPSSGGFPTRCGHDPGWRVASRSASAACRSSSRVTRSIIEKVSWRTIWEPTPNFRMSCNYRS